MRYRSVLEIPASLLVLGLVAAGCSGGGSGGGGAASTAAGSAAAFAVVGTTPAHGEVNVPVDDPLYVTFSQDVNPASLQGGITLSTDQGPVAVSVQASTPRVAAVTPAAHLTSATGHLLRVTTQVATSAGVPLAQEVVVRFTTSSVVPITGPGAAPIAPATPGPWRAGVAVVDVTPPVGVPLAGFGGGDRRRSFPDLNPFNDYTFLEPARGTKDTLSAKAIVLDNGLERVAIVALDAIATEARLVDLAHRKAAARGFGVPLEKVLVCSSHTHSGPGAMSRRLIWQVIACDLYVDRVAQGMADGIAQALVDAEQALAPASVGVGSASVTAATRNRRAADSPDLDDDDIDPELLVIRVDDAQGVPLATVWNFAVHGTHFGASNLEFSADIMGSAALKAQAQGAGVCLFLNGAEGDIKPVGDYHTTGQVLADGILSARRAAAPAPTGVLQTTHEMVDMGAPYLSLGLRHLSQSQQSTWFVQGLVTLGINPQIDFSFPAGWMEREFRYQAIRIGRSVITSVPGEPIHRIGLGLKQDGLAKGFDHVLPACLANGHGSYFTTATEYGYGGYEGLATMFGPRSADILSDACNRLMDRLRP